MKMESVLKNAVLPFAGMIMIECGEVGMTSLAKKVLSNGVSNLVYVVYYNALGTLILLPYFIFHSFRSKRPPISFYFYSRFFLLGLIGICLIQTMAYTGVNYSSPTLAAALGNLVPVFTYLLAIMFGMEKLNFRSSSTRAKLMGTTVSILGAFIVTLYKGPSILMNSPASTSSLRLLLPQKSNWVLGGSVIAITCLLSATWNIFLAATAKEYPDKMTLVFYYNLFGTIQCAVLALIAERSNPGAWTLHPGIEIIAILYSGMFGNVFRSYVITWCLQKKGPVYVALYKPLGIAIAAFIGVTFLGEVLHVGSAVGAIVIAFGFYTVMWGLAKETDRVADEVSSLESPTEETSLLQNTR